MLGTLQKCALCNFHVFSMILKTCGYVGWTQVLHFFQMKYFSNTWPFRKSFDRKFKIQNSKTIIPRIPFRSVQLWISNLVWISFEIWKLKKSLFLKIWEKFWNRGRFNGSRFEDSFSGQKKLSAKPLKFGCFIFLSFYSNNTFNTVSLHHPQLHCTCILYEKLLVFHLRKGPAYARTKRRKRR